ncbi:MAG TPA: hypothetical protein VHB72_04065 [Candidatus Saccharimonadales bacterium]|nr:hypothetical protein [Candidatus Saccharimonadales bacterium]
MAASAGDTLYDRVVRVTHVYLGPAADRFIARQVQSHLHKPPSEITNEDLLKLVDWIRVAVSLLTDDMEVVEEYIGQLRKLTSEPPTPSNKKGGSHG